MLVKDQFKRMGWEELFMFDLKKSMEEEKIKAGNPFSKKNTFTSILPEEVRNRYASIENITKQTNGDNYKNTSGTNTYKSPTDNYIPSENVGKNQ